MRVRIFHRESGQAVVEAAIVLPLFIAILLGILQLTLIHQARLLTEYAAFQAARAGVVWQGDPRKMKDAAIFVLAPTACPTRAPLAAQACSLRKGKDEWARQTAGIAALQLLSSLDEVAIFPGVHVHILNPHWPSHRELFTVGPNRDQLDFDSLAAHADARNGRPPAAIGADAARAANILTIQVQYWFELKIPIADWMIWKAWSLLSGFSSHEDEEINRGKDYRLLRPGSLAAMHAAAAFPSNRREAGYFIPIVTHHSMRMQSNFDARFIRDCSCFEGDGCSSECKAW